MAPCATTKLSYAEARWRFKFSKFQERIWLERSSSSWLASAASSCPRSAAWNLVDMTASILLASWAH
eukprot:759816-Hanusia_phi.AAC.3